MYVRWVSAVGICWACFAGGVAAQQQFVSGASQTAMIELYTSQGCSSCPPAEEFLNTFVDNPRLWSSFVPIAFHVDYWDYLGWKDRFALPSNAQRQRRYASLKNVRTVYTPGFVVNGREWRPGWLSKRLDAGSREVGTLTVTLEGDRIDARFTAAEPPSGLLELHVGVLGMGLGSDIRAGENRGRASHHEFVLLSHQRFGATDGAWQGPLQPWDSKGAARVALVAWVSTPGDPAPLQATGGYLDE